MTIAPAMGRFSTAFPLHAASFILVASVPGFPVESAYSEGIVPPPFATTSLLALTFDHSYAGSPSKLRSSPVTPHSSQLLMSLVSYTHNDLSHAVLPATSTELNMLGAFQDARRDSGTGRRPLVHI